MHAPVAGSSRSAANLDRPEVAGLHELLELVVAGADHQVPPPKSAE